MIPRGFRRHAYLCRLAPADSGRFQWLDRTDQRAMETTVTFFQTHLPSKSCLPICRRERSRLSCLLSFPRQESPAFLLAAWRLSLRIPLEVGAGNREATGNAYEGRSLDNKHGHFASGLCGSSSYKETGCATPITLSTKCGLQQYLDVDKTISRDVRPKAHQSSLVPSNTLLPVVRFLACELPSSRQTAGSRLVSFCFQDEKRTGDGERRVCGVSIESVSRGAQQILDTKRARAAQNTPQKRKR